MQTDPHIKDFAKSFSNNGVIQVKGKLRTYNVVKNDIPDGVFNLKLTRTIDYDEWFLDKLISIQNSKNNKIYKVLSRGAGRTYWVRELNENR